MKIRTKLTLALLAMAALVLLVGYYAVSAGQKALQESIGKRAVARAGAVLDGVDRSIYMRIEQLRAYAKDLAEEPALIASNREFDALDDVDGYIAEKDQAWQAAGQGEATPFMDDLINSELSGEIRGELELKEFYREKRGHEVFSEVFVTNKYGANAAQSQRTTDYYQADEEWWQEAKKDGLFLADVEYDRSAEVYSIDICVAVENEESGFLGVLKAVVNIEEVVGVLRQEEGRGTAQFKLLTRDNRVIYATEEYEFLKHLPERLSFHRPRGHGPEHVDYFIAEGDMPGEGEELFAHAHSNGFRDYEGLGWILIVEHETKEIFAPVARLRNRIAGVSVAITALAVLLSVLISRSVSGPIQRLAGAAARIGGGNLNARVEAQSRDEMGELAGTFNRMAESLRTSYASRAELEREVTERKRAEGQQKREKERAEKYLNIAGVMLAIVNADEKIALINKKGREILGYREEELIGQNWFDLLVPEKIRDEVRGVFRMLMAGDIKPVEYYENPLLTKDGDERLAAFHNTVTRDATGRITSILLSAEDITERKRAEEELEALNAELERSNRDLQDFTHTVSHDLQAPLRKVHTFGQFLEEDCGESLPENGREHLRRMQDATVRMKGLIQHLLTLARVGTRGAELAPVEPKEVIETVLSDLDDRIEECGAEVTVEDDLPPVMADRVQLGQLFQNLLENALKFRSPERPPRVTISAREQAGKAVFSVADNGIGIRDEYREKVFGVFQRLNRREDYEGSGVGLALCEKIVRRHGGRIWVESQEGEGSTFYFTLKTAREPGSTRHDQC